MRTIVLLALLGGAFEHVTASANLRSHTLLTSQWNTSSTCLLPKSSGQCRTIKQHFYYDTHEKKCKPFHYGRCDQKGNNFETEQLCKASCAPTTEYEAYCLSKTDSGPCLEEIHMWTFNAKSGVCETFVYGGCDGNNNKYQSIGDCNSKCLNVTLTESHGGVQALRYPFIQMTSSGVCLLRKEAGPCNAYLPRYYFDQATGKCEGFIYGGCAGNGNNFLTPEECFNACNHYPGVMPRA